MEQTTKNICPTCQGKKVMPGVCECSMEWRGTNGDDGWEDCQCTPEQECPSCLGTGLAESGDCK